MPIAHLLGLWVIVFGAAAITVGLFSGYGTPAVIAALVIGIAFRIWSQRR